MIVYTGSLSTPKNPPKKVFEGSENECITFVKAHYLDKIQNFDINEVKCGLRVFGYFANGYLTVINSVLE